MGWCQTRTAARRMGPRRGWLICLGRCSSGTSTQSPGQPGRSRSRPGGCLVSWGTDTGSRLAGWQLRAATRRAVLAADPAAARRRKERALREARVERWDEQTGTAALAGRDLLPATVLAADQNLTALARSLKHAGVPGTMDQLRAQVYLALLTGQSVSSMLPPVVPAPQGTAGPAPAGPAGDMTGLTGGPAGLGAGQGLAGEKPGLGQGLVAQKLGLAGQGLAGSVNLTMPLATWLGLSDAPGDAAGFGPLDADDSRDCADLAGRHHHQRTRNGPVHPPAPVSGLPAAPLPPAPHHHPAGNLLLPRLPPPRHPLRPGTHHPPRPRRQDLRMQPRPIVQPITTQVASASPGPKSL